MKLKLRKDPRGSAGRKWGVWRNSDAEPDVFKQWLGNMPKEEAKAFIRRLRKIIGNPTPEEEARRARAWAKRMKQISKKAEISKKKSLKKSAKLLKKWKKIWKKEGRPWPKDKKEKKPKARKLTKEEVKRHKRGKRRRKRRAGN